MSPAGGSSTSKRQNAQRKQPEDTPSLPMGKHFASSDKAVRDKAVDSLRLFLIAQGDKLLSQSEMTKLWRGLYFCFWHSDKPIVQNALATELAELILNIPSTPAALHFLKGFWDVMLQEWPKIDRFRLDKYHLLIRRFINASFRLQIREKWDGECCEAYEYIMTGPNGPLRTGDTRISTSLACHLGDIYLEELEKALSDVPDHNVPILDLLHPFMVFTSRTPTMTAQQRVIEAMFEPFLSALTTASTDGERQAKRPRMSLSIQPPTYSNVIAKSTLHSRYDAETSGQDPDPSPEKLRAAFLKMLFSVASEEDSREPNRKKMYAFWKMGMAEGRNDERGWDGS